MPCPLIASINNQIKPKSDKTASSDPELRIFEEKLYLIVKRVQFKQPVRNPVQRSMKKIISDIKREKKVLIPADKKEIGINYNRTNTRKRTHERV